jgi:hypothetical protein
VAKSGRRLISSKMASMAKIGENGAKYQRLNGVKA